MKHGLYRRRSQGELASQCGAGGRRGKGRRWGREEEVSSGITEYEKDSEFVAYLDAGRIQFPMIIRNFRPGDRFIPLGMKGQKKVKDFFIDLKIPSQKRALVPILMSQGNIVWICGNRLDNRFKITENE